MKISNPRRSTLLLGLAPALLLAACGGDSTSSGAGGSATSTDSGGLAGTGDASATSSGATTTGAGGGSSSTTGSGSTGSTSSSTSSGGGPLSCAGLPLCDDFESAAPGGPPDPAKWAIVTPSCSGTGTVTVDSTQAHSGSRSVKVTGKGGYCNHVFFANTAAPAAIGKTIYGRFFLRISDPLGPGHTTFLTMKDSADGGKDLRLGGQNQVMIWNRESDDATLPELSPTGTALSVSPSIQAWHCVELMVDGSTGQMQTWMDGSEIAGLHEDGVPTADIDKQWLTKIGWKPTLVDFKLGWESYAGQDMTLWFDDVALGPARLGCD